MIYGNIFLKEEYGYIPDSVFIQEGVIKDKLLGKIRSLFERPKNKQKEISSANRSMLNDYNVDTLELEFEKGSSADMDKLYNTEGLAFEGYDFYDTSKKVENFAVRFAERFLEWGIYIKNKSKIYTFTGKDVNKHYDLSGDNKYKDDYHITVISFNDIYWDKSKDVSWGAAKQSLDFRYWKDVVDNNEYREYLKGKHKASPQIQWLIDANNQ